MKKIAYNNRKIGTTMLLIVVIGAILFMSNKIKNDSIDDQYNYFNQTLEDISKIISTATEVTDYAQTTFIQTTTSTIETKTPTTGTNPTKNLEKEKEVLSHIIFDSVEKDNTLTYTALIIISSHVNNRNRRNQIRESWGSIFNWVTVEKYLIVFFVSRTTDAKPMIEIGDEAKIRRDIVYLDLFEDFYLLTKKVIIELTWAKNNAKFKALLKGDDDTFVNIDNVIQFIKINDITDGYFGNRIANARVRRYGRYQVSNKEFEKDIYEPYCSGGGFILTNSSVYKMTKLFDLNKILKIDDAFVGEIAYQAEIPARGIKGFYMYNDNCQYKNDIMVSHPALITDCNNFLLKKSLIDNGKLPKDSKLENQLCYDGKTKCEMGRN